jgi:hypothetical protein
LLTEGKTCSAVAKELGLKLDTLSKAVRAGRLVKPIKKTVLQARKANAI